MDHSSNNLPFDALQALGAGEFAHLNGPLNAHLEGTAALLRDWGNDETLCSAGLYHAVYGTAGYAERLVTLDERKRIRALIGDEAERIVYSYCACDRESIWPQIGSVEVLRYKDRFTGEQYPVSDEWLRGFCELTVANELEIAMNSEAFVDQYGPNLRPLFARMKPYLSAGAYDAFLSVLGRLPATL